MSETIWVVKRHMMNKPRETGEWKEGTVESTHITKEGALQAAKNILASIPHNDGKCEDFDRLCTIKTISISVVKRTITEMTIDLTYKAEE